MNAFIYNNKNTINSMGNISVINNNDELAKTRLDVFIYDQVR